MGHVDSGDDSDLDNDEALGECDEERFADFTFRGSTSTRKKKRSKPGRFEEESGDGDESSEDGEGFINWSEMLDRPDSRDEEEAVDKKAKRKPKRLVSDDEEGEDDEPSDSSMSGESESGDEDDEESIASFSEGDETPEDPSKLAELQVTISSLPSTMKSPKGARGNDPNEGKTPNEYNLTMPSTSDKLTVEDPIPTITDPKLKQSLKLIADNAPSKSSRLLLPLR